MIAVDTNILVYAHRPECTQHVAATRVIAALANGRGPWGIPFHCLIEFAAVCSNRKVWAHPTPHPQLLEQVQAWREAPSMRILGDDDASWEHLAALLVSAKPVGGAMHDARIAACCLAHGVSELWTSDRDFGRYAPLQTRNPLIDAE